MGAAFAIIGLFVAASYLVVGAFAWWLRPRNRTGRLMVAVGIGYLAFLHTALTFVPGFWTSIMMNGWMGLLAQLVLALPTGRLGTPTRRLLVGIGYALVLLPAFGRFVPRGTVPLVDWLLHEQRWLAFWLGLGILAAQAYGWWRTSALQRRLLAPMLCGCLVVTGLFVVERPTRISDLFFLVMLPLIPIAYLVGLLRQRLDRAGVAGLVVRLGERPRLTRLSEELAATLHDPTVLVGFWSWAGGHYVDADGEPMAPVRDGQVMSRIDRGGHRIAVLLHDRALLDEPELVAAACAATALALENARLQADLHAQLRELAASRSRLAHAAESGRRQLGRDLHDGVQQRLLAAAMLLGRAEQAGDQPLVTEAKGTVLATLDELRALCQGIHPPVLTERGLPGALRELAETVPVQVDLEITGDPAVSADVETVAYYVIAEALTNVIKHADTGAATVRVEREGPSLSIRVTDQGDGGATPHPGSGLAGLADRVAAIGGELVVTSPAGVGTTIIAELPCGS